MKFVQSTTNFDVTFFVDVVVQIVKETQRTIQQNKKTLQSETFAIKEN